MSSYVIIGAGFTGLMYAVRAIAQGHRVTVYESESRSGGLISTERLGSGLVETAANGILNSRPLEELCEELQVTPVSTLKHARRRYIWHDGRPRRVPFGITDLMAVAWRALTNDAAIIEGESVADWGNRVLGEKATNRLIAPALTGIYAGDIKSMDATLVLGSTLSGHGSLIRQLRNRRRANRHRRPSTPGTVSFQSGMGELVEAMRNRVESSGGIHYSSPVKDLSALQTEHPNARIVVTCGLQGALPLIRKLSPKLQEPGERLKTLPVVTVTRFGRTSLLKRPGFGILFPHESPVRARGILMNDSIFPDRSSPGLFSETYIYGGKNDREIASLSESGIMACVEQDRKTVSGERAAPVEYKVTVWPNALPEYTKDLLAFNRALDSYCAEHGNIDFEGNYRYGIGLRTIINRCEDHFSPSYDKSR